MYNISLILYNMYRSPLFHRILELLLECAQSERLASSGRTAVSGEPDFLGKELDELVVRVAVPIKVGSAIIGPKGAHVQRLKEEPKGTKDILQINKHVYHTYKYIYIETI